MIANPLPAFRPAATVTISRGAYRNWPGCFTLSNPECRLVVVPQIGRIMHFSAVHSEIGNVLWQPVAIAEHGKPSSAKTQNAKQVQRATASTHANESVEWINHGGEKVWPWPQEAWPRALGRTWPPPDECWRRPHVARQVSADTVRLTSPPLSALGFRIVRDITLAADACRATVFTRFERLHMIDQDDDSDALDDGPPRPPSAWAAWTVAQINLPDRVIVRLDSRTLLPRGMKTLAPAGKFSSAERDDDLLTVELPVKTNDAKLGFDGDAIAAVYEHADSGEKLIFTQKRLAPLPGTAYESRAKFIPGEALQLYASRDYAELELTSPRHMNAPELRVEWELHHPRHRSVESVIRGV